MIEQINSEKAEGPWQASLDRSFFSKPQLLKEGLKIKPSSLEVSEGKVFRIEKVANKLGDSNLFPLAELLTSFLSHLN